ncbi:MAG TPA: cbb3-type cytochrome oxidase assembly protein CcoS [Saprospiraceae bacterium]|jgi:cbb3-type cytochrome oxidase maturation protein|nr:cbb3-type cytochrome oxidase assembly protein CcoS [Saprospiraceae bacterium]MCC6687962.1 cbb3-type cytochrome oxidase assembly protein CcoS [Saprospiraceae bacterium]HMV22731.1 cbb3-type cytochrome oxidase assembly protein CcoS [Saprospiraceae bacterium]HMW75395.1 cbb3-type cytochrome oxidase assembly protein CcoS [Saprospiraceae bacterium]HMX81730.1 cbb3-type cytochrome oxidase assembly protein CcoS [Saprospiraceae bacterium]
MGVIFILLFVSLAIALLFLWAFLWSTKTGQFDDDISPGVRILFDEEKSKTNNN